MKKLLMACAVLLVLAVAGLAIFIATFDADRYRPMVIEQMASALGKPVTLDRLSLGWRGGLAVELHGLAVYPGPQASGEPAASVERASAVVNLLPLIRKRVSIASVVVDRPIVRLRRDASGAIEVVGLKVVGAPAAASGQTAQVGEGAGAPPVAFDVSMVRLKDGYIGWTDEMAAPPMAVEAKSLDVTLRNLSPEKVDIELRVSLFSDTQNLQFSGRVWLPQGGSPGKLEHARLSTDLRQWDLRALSRAVPAVQPLGLQGGTEGRLIVSVDQLVLGPSALGSLAARVQISEGKLALATLGKPIDNITLDLVATPERIDLQQASAILGGGVVSASGFIDQPASAPSTTLELTLEELLVEELAPAGRADDPRLFGRVSASFKGTGQGLDWPGFSRTLNGRGRLSVSQMKLVNLNILREVFSRLSIIPGLADTLQARLPASYQPKLTTKETVFQPVDVDITAQQGRVSWSNLKLVTDSFELQGVGQAGLDGTIASQATLRIDPELSAALVGTVNALGQLNDAQGRMQVPVVIQGQWPRLAVMPDLQYVASRILATKAHEVLGGFLERALGGQQSTGAQESSPPAWP